MGQEESKVERAEKEMYKFSSDVSDFFLKSLTSIGKPGQKRQITPILNLDGIKKGIHTGQDMLITKWKGDEKWKKDMTALVFGSSGIGGWLVGLVFSLGVSAAFPSAGTLSTEDVKNAVQDAVLGIVSSDKISNLNGAMKSIIHTTFIDASSSEFANILYGQARALREELNKLSEAMKSNQQYATMESLDAFITGWGLVSSVYLTVHLKSPSLVTYDAYKNQVDTARKEIMESSKVCFKAHCDQIKMESHYDEIYHGCPYRLVLKFKGNNLEEVCKINTPNHHRRNPMPKFFGHMEKPFRDLLANSFDKFIQDRIEPRVPMLQ